MAGRLAAAVAAVVVAGVLSPDAAAQATSELRDFNASGEGQVETLGWMAEGSNRVRVQSLRTWRPGQGIRVRRAGPTVGVHDADPETTPRWLPGRPDVAVFHETLSRPAPPAVDPEDRSDAAVVCRLSPRSPETGAVDLCGVKTPGMAFTYDELRFWVRTSTPTAEGQLSVVLMGPAGPIEFAELELPAATSRWTEVFLPIEGEAIGAVEQLVVHCREACAGLEVHLDQFRLVTDLLGLVQATEEGPLRVPTISIEEMFDNRLRPKPAQRAVRGEVVYHDDTRALQRWLESGPGLLTARNGIYYMSGSGGKNLLPIRNETTIRCQSTRAVFKSTGRSQSGSRLMFVASDAAPTEIRVENCGFDANGWNRQDFQSFVSLVAKPNLGLATAGISVSGNRFFDDASPGYEGCDIDQDFCRTHQRQYVVVGAGVKIDIAGNDLRDGGRIKVQGGAYTSDVTIVGNRLDFINDNGISVVQRSSGVTERVTIRGNTVTNPVGSGIFFGADGEDHGGVIGMTTRDITITDNDVIGAFHAGIKGILPERAERITVAGNTVRAERTRALEDSWGAAPAGIVLRRGVPHCSDGKDNDEDRLTDLNDPGCRHPRDADESEAAGDLWTNFPTSDLVVTGNDVLGAGPYGVFEPYAVSITGPLTGLAFSANKVGCPEAFASDDGPPPCPSPPFERAIGVRHGPFEDMELAANKLRGGNRHLEVRGLNGQAATGLSIHDNEFSSAAGDAHIFLESPAAAVIEGRLTRNTFRGEAPRTMICTPERAYQLVMSGNSKPSGMLLPSSACGPGF